MAIALKELYGKARASYQMQLIAGAEGLGNIVQWVHIIEDDEVVQFLRGHELTFTTGIRRSDTKWLMQFTKLLCEHQASGLILNIGPYISEIPEDLIIYCNQVKFPLFTTPWHSRLVDMTRTFCNQIMDSEVKEESIAGAFRDIILGEKEMQYPVSILKRNGFNTDGIFTIAALRVTPCGDWEMTRCLESVRFHVEKILTWKCDRYGCYIQDEKIVLIFADCQEDEIQVLLQMMRKAAKDQSRYRIQSASGYQGNGIISLADNYRLTMKIMNLAVLKNQETYTYNTLGIYKILITNKDEKSMMDFYYQYLGKLVCYDESNGTDYVEFLEKYIRSGFSTHDLAEQEFVHRNTIHYKIKKIRGILGCDLGDWKDRFYLVLSYYIKNLLFS